MHYTCAHCFYFYFYFLEKCIAFGPELSFLYSLQMFKKKKKNCLKRNLYYFRSNIFVLPTNYLNFFCFFFFLEDKTNFVVVIFFLRSIYKLVRYEIFYFLFVTFQQKKTVEENDWCVLEMKIVWKFVRNVWLLNAKFVRIFLVENSKENEEN